MNDPSLPRKHKLITSPDGDAALCLVCRGSYDSIPTHCPGRPITVDQSWDIFRGRLDFIDGAWVESADGEVL